MSPEDYVGIQIEPDHKIQSRLFELKRSDMIRNVEITKSGRNKDLGVMIRT